jgi:hypothetical protein
MILLTSGIWFWLTGCAWKICFFIKACLDLFLTFSEKKLIECLRNIPITCSDNLFEIVITQLLVLPLYGHQFDFAGWQGHCSGGGCVVHQVSGKHPQEPGEAEAGSHPRAAAGGGRQLQPRGTTTSPATAAGTTCAGCSNEGGCPGGHGP